MGLGLAEAPCWRAELGRENGPFDELFLRLRPRARLRRKGGHFILRSFSTARDRILRLRLLIHRVAARAPATLLLRRLQWRLVSYLGEQPNAVNKQL